MAFLDPVFVRAPTPPQEEIRAILPHGMALNIKDPTTDRLVRELAATTGESITTAVTIAVRERLERIRGMAPAEARLQAILRISERAAARPMIDHRTDDELFGWDEDGLPT